MNERLRGERARLQRLLLLGGAAALLLTVALLPYMGWIPFVWFFYIGGRFVGLKCENCGHRVLFDSDERTERPKFTF
jgi:hypothetical protein